MALNVELGLEAVMNFTLRKHKGDKAWYARCQFKVGDKWRFKEKKLKATRKGDAKIEMMEWAQTVEIRTEPTPDVLDYAAQVIDEKLALHAILPASATDYRKSMAAWKPFLSGTQLHEVTSEQIKTGLMTMLRTLSPNTVIKRYVALNMAFAHAVSVGDIRTNPMDTIPRPRREAPEQNPLSKESVQRLKELLALIPASPWTMMVYLCLMAGLRSEEAAALQLRDIDLEARKGWIRRAVGYGDGGSYIAAPKSKQARDFAISEGLAAQLEPWIRQHVAECGDSPTKWLLGTDERWADARSLGRDWSRFCDLCSITGIAGRKPTLHDLRHTFATRCIASGMDVKTLQSLLGHASAAITLDVYASADVEAKAASATIIDQAI